VRTAEFLPKLVNLLKMSRHLLKNSLVKQKTIQLTINVATSNPTNKLLLQRVRHVAPLTVHLRLDRRPQPTPTRNRLGSRLDACLLSPSWCIRVEVV